MSRPSRPNPQPTARTPPAQEGSRRTTLQLPRIALWVIRPALNLPLRARIARHHSPHSIPTLYQLFVRDMVRV